MWVHPSLAGSAQAATGPELVVVEAAAFSAPELGAVHSESRLV